MKKSDWHRHHDIAVGNFLEGHFGPAVIEPARLHVEAKRYLCATDPDYINRLSAASIHTLEKQGGPLGPREIENFESNPYFINACQLRRWEEEGKSAGANCLDFASFRPILMRTRIN